MRRLSGYHAQNRMLEKIDAARELGPILSRVTKLLEKPAQTGRPLTKKQNKALIELIRNQAGAIWGRQFKLAIENNDWIGAMAVCKELIALDIEEHKVGKKEKKQDKVKPTLKVFIPEVNESC